jgi:hypothetical protein
MIRTAALVVTLLLSATAAVAQHGGQLAPDPVIVYESPQPKKYYPRSPAIYRLESGRLVITMEYNLGGVRHVPDLARTDGKPHRGLVFLSDDGGKTVRQAATNPLIQARAFEAGKRLYLLGHQGPLGIMYSEDQGETWSKVAWLSDMDDTWHQAPCNVRIAHGRVYLVMEKTVEPAITPWPVHRLAPVVMAAPLEADLTKRESWTFSNIVTYTDMVKAVGEINGIGMPFYIPGPTIPNKPGMASRPMGIPGWLETHIVTFPDPDHLWHDPNDRTMYLYARAHTGTTNYACLSKAVEAEDGSITVGSATAPSGEPLLYLRLPGGHLKFYLLYDEESRLYWLASNQSTDSMTRPERLPDSRYALPDNERHRLVLHFSKNAVDWCFAGVIDQTNDPRQARSYPSMCMDGDDLVVVARSGNERAKNAHDGNMVTLHRIKDFRKLAY